MDANTLFAVTMVLAVVLAIVAWRQQCALGAMRGVTLQLDRTSARVRSIEAAIHPANDGDPGAGSGERTRRVRRGANRADETGRANGRRADTGLDTESGEWPGSDPSGKCGPGADEYDDNMYMRPLVPWASVTDDDPRLVELEAPESATRQRAPREQVVDEYASDSDMPPLEPWGDAMSEPVESESEPEPMPEVELCALAPHWGSESASPPKRAMQTYENEPGPEPELELEPEQELEPEPELEPELDSELKPEPEPELEPAPELESAFQGDEQVDPRTVALGGGEPAPTELPPNSQLLRESEAHEGPARASHGTHWSDSRYSTAATVSSQPAELLDVNRAYARASPALGACPSSAPSSTPSSPSPSADPRIASPGSTPRGADAGGGAGADRAAVDATPSGDGAARRSRREKRES
jgi:hypothetical protein